MVRRSHLAAALAVLATTVALGCQMLPAGTPAGGQLGMRIEWPFRVQAIPTNTAAVAVAVFRNGALVPAPNGRSLSIIGKGSGSVTYRGLPNGDYRVVSVAYGKEANPLAGGAAPARIDTNVNAKTQVILDLQASNTGVAGELSPYLSEVQAYLATAMPSPSPSTPPSPGPSPTSGTDTDPTTPTSPTPGSSSTVPTPAPSATPASSGGGGGSSSPSGLTFTGGF